MISSTSRSTARSCWRGGRRCAACTRRGASSRRGGMPPRWTTRKRSTRRCRGMCRRGSPSASSAWRGPPRRSPPRAGAPAGGAPFPASPAASPSPTEAGRAAVVVLCADLRGFSRITETIGVHNVVDMLNEYFSVLTEAAYQHEGTIFNMAGDSLLVGFNVPFAQPDAPARAWRTAMDMVSHFAPVSADWRARFGVATGVGIGLCRGEAIIGNIGSPHFMSYTIIGDTVNTAARLMQMAQADEVLVSATLYEAIRPLVPAARAHARGAVALRGKSEAVGVYSITL